MKNADIAGRHFEHAN